MQDNLQTNPVPEYSIATAGKMRRIRWHPKSLFRFTPLWKEAF
ncbi:MAG TPA: hypothetical protein P5348_00720 [Bacteroidales bacterium]|nr:hypothetical protein [Bacteroidales bacterium]